MFRNNRMAKDFPRIYSHFGKLFVKPPPRWPTSANLNPGHFLINTAIMADGGCSAEFVEIQKQYLQMATLKGFVWKVSFLCSWGLVLEDFILNSPFDFFRKLNRKIST